MYIIFLPKHLYLLLAVLDVLLEESHKPFVLLHIVRIGTILLPDLSERGQLLMDLLVHEVHRVLHAGQLVVGRGGFLWPHSVDLGVQLI